MRLAAFEWGARRPCAHGRKLNLNPCRGAGAARLATAAALGAHDLVIPRAIALPASLGSVKFSVYLMVV